MNFLDNIRHGWYLNAPFERKKNRIWRLWAKADAVFGGLIGYGAQYPFELKIVDEIITRYPDMAKDFFLCGANHENPRVVGYSLIGLAKISRKLLSDTIIADPRRRTHWVFASRGAELSLDEIKELILQLH